jgi:signal transduction histidine kinase
MVSHELRTPLTPVVMSLAAMEQDPQLPEDLQDEVAMLRRNVGLETKLIDDLLDVTSIRNGKFRLNVRPVGIHPLLREVAEIVGGEAENRSQKLTLSLTAHDDRVGGDPVRLHQVFWNILKNAVKFTPIGGEISIRTLNPKSAAIAIEVKDGGVGIAPEACRASSAPSSRRTRAPAGSSVDWESGLPSAKRSSICTAAASMPKAPARERAPAFEWNCPSRATSKR